jgi:hypothetical protein
MPNLSERDSEATTVTGEIDVRKEVLSGPD